MFRKELYDQIVILIRSRFGDIYDLSGFQVYMKFKSVVIDLDVFSRPKESLWPFVLLDVFMLDSID